MRIIYFILGFLFLVIGIIGVYLPLVPRAFPLMIAAFLFARSSPTFHTWLTTHRFYKENVLPIVERRAVTMQRKLGILGVTTATFSIGLFFTWKLGWVFWLIVAIMICHWIGFIKYIPTETKDKRVRRVQNQGQIRSEHS